MWVVRNASCQNASAGQLHHRGGAGFDAGEERRRSFRQHPLHEEARGVTRFAAMRHAGALVSAASFALRAAAMRHNVAERDEGPSR